MPLTILKSSPIVKPTIRNGSKINHTIGNTRSRIKAMGQHVTNSSPHSTRAMNVLKDIKFGFLRQISLQFYNALVIK
jgi:hypothetical protein